MKWTALRNRPFARRQLNMNKMPEGFPLEPIDCDGVRIQETDFVLVRKIPESLTHDFDQESKKHVMSCEGKIMKIDEIDDYGFVWLELVVLETGSQYVSEKFSLEPKYVQKSTGSLQLNEN